MFELKETTAKLANFNPRPERHCNENKLAGDIKFELAADGADLEHFGTGLRHAMFRDERPADDPRLLREGEPEYRAVRFPRLAYGWDEEFGGYELHINKGLGLVDPLVLVDVTLCKFRFRPMEGGKVAVTFAVQCHPDSEEAGLLCALQQETVTVTVVPPIRQDELELEEPEPTDPEPAQDQLDQAAEQLEKAA